MIAATQDPQNADASQKELLKKWIVAGAAYEPHWAYIKPKRPLAPQVQTPNGFATRSMHLCCR